MRRSPGDADLWRRAMHGVAPLRERSAAPAPRTAARAAAERGPVGAPPIGARAALPPLAVDRFAGIDRASAERLKRGQHPVEARLDLHGMTQDEAHRALGGFLRTARATGKRVVLVITGRGRVGGGVLRAAVPRWLAGDELRPLLLAIATAQPRDGGAGALYVMLRRNAMAEQ